MFAAGARPVIYGLSYKPIEAEKSPNGVYQGRILDVEKTAAELGKSNSDERNEKVTGVSLLGIEKARTLMNQLYDDSFAKIEKIKGFESDALTGLLREVQHRNH